MDARKILLLYGGPTIRIFKKERGIPQYLSRCFSNTTLHQIEDKEKEAFHKTLPSIIESITNHPNVADIPGLECWIKKIMLHNVIGGKGNRGLSVVMAYKMLKKPDNITEKSMAHAYTLGWCCEMAYLLILDDLMDGSTSRRGQQCWYRLPEVGTSSAVNDATILYNCMFYVLKQNFGLRRDYAEMLNVLNETTLNASFGQYLDTKTSTKTKDYSKFTTDIHRTIVKYKTAYYTYDMPTYLGLLLADYKIDEETRKMMQNIALELGIFFQMQDDYIDCYGDETITGKVGTDIQEGKCSWLAVNALERCNASQRIIFTACYGSNEFAHIERIKWLYDQLKLPEVYKQVETQYYEDILEKINKLQMEELRNLFYSLLTIIYQRKK